MGKKILIIDDEEDMRVYLETPVSYTHLRAHET